MDNVKHPGHYCKGGIECIDAIKAAVSGITDPFEAYCTGNIIKYAWRWDEKNGVEDLKKAAQYVEFIRENREKPTTEESSEVKLIEIDHVKYDWLSTLELSEIVCRRSPDCANCVLNGICDTSEYIEADRAKMIEFLEKEGEE